MFSNGECGGGVIDDYTLSCIDRHLQNWQEKHIRDEDRTNTVIMDGEVLDPFAVDLLRLRR